MRPPISTPIIRIEIAGTAYEATLPAQRVRIGRGEACELRLASRGLGDVHCALEPLSDGRHVVRDLGSGYPTKVNGIETQQVSLQPGDVIEVGDARVVYDPMPAPAQAPQAAPSPATTSASGAGRTHSTAAAAASSAPQGGAAPPVPTASGQSEARRGHPLTGPLIALAAASLVAFALAWFIGQDDTSGDRARAEGRLERGRELHRAKDYAGALSVFEKLSADRDATDVARRADRWLGRTKRAIQAAEDALEQLWEARLDVDMHAIDTARQVFLLDHGSGYEQRYDDLIGRVSAAQASWREEQLTRVGTRAAASMKAGQFADARDAWLDLRKAARGGVGFGEEVTAALKDVDTRAGEAAGELLLAAQAASERGDPQAAVRMLGSALRGYEGLGVGDRLAEAVRTYEAQVREAQALRPPADPGDAAAVGDASPGTRPKTADPTAVKAAEAALAAAKEAAAAWRFADGKALIEAALADGVTGPVATRLQHRLGDLDLALLGLDALIKDINDKGAKYRRLEMASRLVASLVKADRSAVVGAISGGTSSYRWASLSPERVASIARRMRAQGEPALGLAALMRLVGAESEVDGHLFAAGRGGVAEDRLFGLIARWRGEVLPDGGYVLHGKTYVSLAERARLELEAEILAAARKVRHRDAKIWTTACEQLFTMGPEARPHLLEALHGRRTDVVEDLSKLRVFTSQRTKAKLYDELRKRRQHALALIENARAWPYPNPSGQNTDEVASRVDQVRQVWETPFDVIVQLNKEAKEKLSAVAAIDEYLVRADPDYEPNVSALRERVNAGIDMPAFTPTSSATSARQYSLKVLAYNVKVDTTATPQEKECVLAVNEYRMMMGREAVKINERLTRAARGHSRHMREHVYFAHNVPANKGASKQNRTPGDRARTQGYGGGVGENIARGTWTGRDAFNAWFHSSGHHRNMIRAGWREMGAGRSGGSWWTQPFGAKRGKSLDAPDPLPDPDAPFAPEPEDASGRPTDGQRPELPAEQPPGLPPDWPGLPGLPEGEQPPEEDAG